MPYDYTRVKVGDTVRDGQSLKEGRIIDIQMAGQWVAFVTIYYASEGIKRDYAALLKDAPAGVNIAAASQEPRTSVPSGQGLDLRFDLATSGLNLSVVRKATEVEALASQATKKEAPRPMNRLKRFIEDLYAGKVRAATDPSTEIKPSVDKSLLLSLVEELENRGESSNGGVSKDLVRAIITPGSGTPAKRVEKVLDLLPSASKHKEAVRELSRVIVTAEKRSGAISGKFAAAKGAQAAQALSQVKGAGNWSYLRDLIPPLNSHANDILFNRSEAGSINAIHGIIGHYGTDYARTSVLAPIDEYLNLFDVRSRALSRVQYNLRSVDRMWGSLLANPEGTVTKVHSALEVARYYGAVSGDDAESIMTDLVGAFGSGHKGAHRFHSVRSRVGHVLSQLNGNDSFRESEIARMRDVRSYLQSALSTYEDSALDVAGMADDASDRIDAYRKKEGLISTSRDISHEAAHKRATLQKAELLGKDPKFGRIIEAAEHVRKQKAFDNIVEREWQGMRYEILGVLYDEQGRPKVAARPAASRVIDSEGFELLTNIRLKGRSAKEVLKTTITDIIAGGMDDRAFLGLSDMYAEGGRIFDSSLPSQVTSDSLRQARLNRIASSPISIAGHQFESMSSVMSAATGVDETSAWQNFQRQIAAAVQAEHGTLPATERGATTRLGVPFLEVREEAVQNAIAGYDMHIRTLSGLSVQDAHNEAMREAVKAATNPTFKRSWGPSLDKMLGSGTMDAALARTGQIIPGVLDNIQDAEELRNQKVAVVLSKRLDLDSTTIDALMNQDLSPVHHTAIRRNLQALGIMDDDILDAFIDHSQGKDALKRASLVASGLPEDLAEAFVKRDTESLKIAAKYLKSGVARKLTAAGVDAEMVDLVMGGHFTGLYSRTRGKAEKIVSTYNARMSDTDHLFNFLAMDMDAKSRRSVQGVMAGETDALLGFLPATKRRIAAQYYNAGVYGILPESTLNKVHCIFKDDAKLEHEFARVRKQEGKAIAEKVADEIVFGRTAVTGTAFNPIIADLLPQNVLDGLRAMTDVVDTLKADEDFLSIPLHSSGLKELMANGNALVDLLSSHGLARTHEISVGGQLATGYQVRKNDRVFTIADKQSLIDQAKNVFVLNPDIPYTPSAQILLPENMGKLADAAAADNYVTSVTDSRFYTLPGHSQQQFQLISTNETHDQFMRQIRTMKELSEGKHMSLFVLDIEANPLTGDVMARPDRPPGIHEVGWIQAAPEQIDGHWGYKAVGEPQRFVAQAAADERSLIKRVADLVRSSSSSDPIVIATHYKPYDFPTLIERAMAHGMVDDAAELAAAYKGVNPNVSHIDTMLSAQIADPSMRSFSVESAAKALRVKESTWKEAHTTIEDDLAELGILNKSIIEGQANIDHLLSQTSSTEIGGQYLWKVQGKSGEPGRLYRALGNFQTPKMAEQSISGVLLREMQLDDSGKLVASPHLVAEANAAHILGGSISGRFVPVTNQQGEGLLKEKVEDLGSKIVRDMMESPSRPAVEQARLEAIRNQGVKFPQLSSAERALFDEFVTRGGSDLSLLPNAGKFERYAESERTAYWLDQHGNDWRRRAQTERHAAGWIEGEYESVHKPFYEFVRGLGVDDGRQRVLLGKWHEEMNKVLGEFGTGTAEVQPFARQLSVDLPQVGTFGFNISSGSRLSESVNQAARRYTKHLDAVEAATIVGKKATSDQMRAFFASGQDMTALPHEAQDAVRDHVWNNVVFPAFSSSRTDFAKKLTTQADNDILSDALTDPAALRARVLDIGAAPEKCSPQVSEMLTARDHTFYQSRVTKDTMTADILAARDNALGMFRDKWQTIAPATTIEETLPGVIPNTGFFISSLRGKTVDQVIEHYEHQASLRVGEEFDTTYDAIQHGRETARRTLGGLFSDEGGWENLNTPVQQRLLSMFGFNDYADGRAKAFRNRVNGEDYDQEKAALRERISDFSDQIDGVTSPAGLSGLSDPRNPDRSLSDASVSDLRGMSRDRRFPIGARQTLADIATDLSSLTSGGLSTGLEAATGYVPVSIQTQHAAARAAIENAAEYLAGKVSIPQVRLAVAAMGAGSALFLGRKPNVASDEERMSTKQRFERQVTRTEKPLYFRVQARVSGMVDQATGSTEEDLLTGAREAVGAHFAGGVDQNSHSTTDSRKKFSNRVLDGLADRLTNALYPLKD